MITTKKEVLKQVDEGLLRKMHHESGQQGAEFMYTMLHNELEWQVYEGDMSVEQANQILLHMTCDTIPKLLRVDKQYATGIVAPYAQIPVRREARVTRIRLAREASK